MAHLLPRPTRAARHPASTMRMHTQYVRGAGNAWRSGGGCHCNGGVADVGANQPKPRRLQRPTLLVKGSGKGCRGRAGPSPLCLPARPITSATHHSTVHSLVWSRWPAGAPRGGSAGAGQRGHLSTQSVALCCISKDQPHTPIAIMAHLLPRPTRAARHPASTMRMHTQHVRGAGNAWRSGGE